MSDYKTCIVGAGLCGSLLAVKLAQRGFKVSIFEKRADLRKHQIAAGRSINLALSDRGLRALEMVGATELIKPLCIPMNGRLIHDIRGHTTFLPYSGRSGEYINSISRSGLNAALLDLAESIGGIDLFFEHECVGVDYTNKTLKFRDSSGNIVERKPDMVFGTDGAGSAVRRSMMKHSNELLFNFSQHYLEHGYKELSIPPDERGCHIIEKNALHIWPRGRFMVIALPNLDGSFTVTMFHPFDGPQGFRQLDTVEKARQLFEEQFPDLLPLMPDFDNEFFENPTSSLGTIKCYPWNAFNFSLLLGDAAHAIVPFYGQGMNASFEDVWVLDQLLEQGANLDGELFQKFQETRKIDADAIADLAIDNFYEMRDHVANPVFMKKRALETRLEQTYPDYFSKYSLVTFNEDIPYSEAMRRGRLQDQYLLSICEKDAFLSMTDEEILENLQKIAY